MLPPTRSAEFTCLRTKLASWPRFSNLVFAAAKLHIEGFSVFFLGLVEGVNVNTCLRSEVPQDCVGEGLGLQPPPKRRGYICVGPKQSSISSLMSSARALEFPHLALR